MFPLLHTTDAPETNSLWRKRSRGTMHEFWNTSPFHAVEPPMPPITVHSKVKLYPGHKQSFLKNIPLLSAHPEYSE